MTPKDVLRSTWDRWKELVCLNGTLEDYALFTLAKTGSYAAGLGLGYWLWGMTT